MKGSNSWTGRPRSFKTIRVSLLPKKLYELFKQLVGTRRWTTEEELARLEELGRYKNLE